MQHSPSLVSRKSIKNVLNHNENVIKEINKEKQEIPECDDDPDDQQHFIDIKIKKKKIKKASLKSEKIYKFEISTNSSNKLRSIAPSLNGNTKHCSIVNLFYLQFF